MPLIFKKERIQMQNSYLHHCKKKNTHNYEQQTQPQFKFLIPKPLRRLVSNKRCLAL